jgi:SAM-dependent methyltransferase
MQCFWPFPKALARAQRKAEREAISMQLDRGFAEELPYPDASFDRVFFAFMFHHLESDEKEKTLREARRVLKPGGSLHLIDFGGAKARYDGFIARLLHRSELLRDNFRDRIPTFMREAGFADRTEVVHQITIFGRVTYYRATALRAESGAA